MNHLIVGLGGTGGKVIAAFRRTVCEQLSGDDAGRLNLDYLYIDSSPEDIKAADVTNPISSEDPRWRKLGQTVQLAPAQIVFLDQGEFNRVVAEPDDYPAYRRWMGDPALWRSVLDNNPMGIRAGGQIRRFGRYLFAHNATKVRGALQDRFSARSKDGPAGAEWTVHVVAGLAGGTGSGSLVDLCGLIRSVRPGRETKIIQYLVLPETEQTKWAQDNYYANGYAALIEVNAILCGRFDPCHVLSTSESYFADRGERAFDNSFIITNKNKNGSIVDMDGAVPQIIAETMFQTIVASGDADRRDAERPGGGAGVNSQDRGWRDYISGENYGGGFEDDPESPGQATRANRFITFGIKRAVIPRQEIKEYASLAFLRQALLQSLSNNWLEGLGFQERAPDFDAASFVRSDAVRAAWDLTEPRLLLEEKTLDNDDIAWKSLQGEFADPFRLKGEAIIDGGTRNETWVAQLETFAKERYEKQFRRVGAPEFYQLQRDKVAKTRARRSAARIADDLFLKWRNGQMSAATVQQVLEEQVIETRERIAQCGKRAADNKRVEDAKEGERKANAGHYANNGGLLFGGLRFSRKLSLQRHATILAEFHAARARQLAYGLAERTLSLLLPEVEALLDQVRKIVALLGEGVEMAEAQQASRLKTDDRGAERGHIHKLLDDEHVRRVIRRLETDGDLQRRQVDEVRGELCAAMGPQPSFAAFAQLPAWLLLDKLERSSGARVEATLAQMEDQSDRILEGSIIQKLYQDFGADDAELTRFLSVQAREAGSFAKIDETGLAGDVTHAQDRGGVQSTLVAFIPSADGLSDAQRGFREKLVQAARRAGAQHVVDVSKRPNELTFLSFTNRFALRHLEAIGHLKREYDRLIDGKTAALKRLELHLEIDGAELPSIVDEPIEKVRHAAEPFWLIASIDGLLTERANPATGEPEVVVVHTNADGLLSAAVMGSDVRDYGAQLTRVRARQLRDIVRGHLSAKVHRDDRKALEGRLIAFQNDAFTAAQMNESHPAFVRARDMTARARALIA